MLKTFFMSVIEGLLFQKMVFPEVTYAYLNFHKEMFLIFQSYLITQIDRLRQIFLKILRRPVRESKSTYRSFSDTIAETKVKI